MIDKGLLGLLLVEVWSSFLLPYLRYRVPLCLLDVLLNESAADVVVLVTMRALVQGPRRTERRMSEVVVVGRHLWRSHLVLLPF